MDMRDVRDEEQLERSFSSSQFCAGEYGEPRRILPPDMARAESELFLKIGAAVADLRREAGAEGRKAPSAVPRPAPAPTPASSLPAKVVQPVAAAGDVMFAAEARVPSKPESIVEQEAPASRLEAAPVGEPVSRPVPVSLTRPSPRAEAPQAPGARVDRPAAGAMRPILEGRAGGDPVELRTDGGGPGNAKGNGSGGGGGGAPLHRKTGAPNFKAALALALAQTRKNLAIVFAFTVVMNVCVLAVPLYLFQISDRVLTSRSIDTLVMLTLIVGGAIVVQCLLDVFRRQILMRTASNVEVRLGAPILSAAARSALSGSSRDYQILSDLQHIRNFLTGGTLLSMLDAPLAPLFMLAVYLVHPHLGLIVMTAVVLLTAVAWFNKRATAEPFGRAQQHASMSNLNLDALARNSQIINALGMIPEAVRMWGRENAGSLKAQIVAQDRNVYFAGLSKGIRLFTQIALLGWGATLALEGYLTGGMVIAASIIASRALAPVEGMIEGWQNFIQYRTAYGRISQLLRNSPLNMERLRLPNPQGRLDVERVLFVPPPTKKVILNGISFSLKPGESLAIIGNSGAGKSTLGRMLVGSIVPTAGNIRLDLMDMRNWDGRQFGENIGYLPQDIQLFPASIKANIARMREDATDEAIFEAASLADVHELIASFPQGYETYVNGDGAPLSGGQKQRIGLARAFFGNPRLVVLDEPNSNLDTAGEQALARALLAAKRKGTTVVAITQRTSLLRCVDKIMVLKDGTIQAMGERDQMLAALSGKSADGAAGLIGEN